MTLSASMITAKMYLSALQHRVYYPALTIAGSEEVSAVEPNV
jgi:hypothetical protein